MLHTKRPKSSMFFYSSHKVFLLFQERTKSKSREKNLFNWRLRKSEITHWAKNSQRKARNFYRERNLRSPGNSNLFFKTSKSPENSQEKKTHYAIVSEFYPISLETSRWHKTFITTQISKSLFPPPKHQRLWFQPITDKLLCFPTLLTNSPFFCRVVTLRTLHSQTCCCHRVREQAPAHSWCTTWSSTTWCSLCTSSFTRHASGEYFTPGIPTSPAARLFLVL